MVKRDAAAVYVQNLEKDGPVMTSSGAPGVSCAIASAQEVMSHCVGRQLTMTTTCLMMVCSQSSAPAP